MTIVVIIFSAIVMPGLVPGPTSCGGCSGQNVDGRDKPA
jgi:hypothetical protein